METISEKNVSAQTRSKRTDSKGRAFAGSQLQMQLYVDEHTAILDAAIRSATALDGPLRWVSPVRGSGFREFKDAEFLDQVGLAHLVGELRRFWPSSGPRWDGLATAEGKGAPRVVLAEAKSYPREVRGGGCKASDVNNARRRIERALGEAGSELGVEDTAPWMGALYQYANRIAHTLFLRRHGVAAYLVNLCFYDDPHPSRRTTELEWRAAAAALKKEMGLTVTPGWLVDVFLPAADGTKFLAGAI